MRQAQRVARPVRAWSSIRSNIAHSYVVDSSAIDAKHVIADSFLFVPIEPTLKSARGVDVCWATIQIARDFDRVAEKEVAVIMPKVKLTVRRYRNR